MGIFQNGIKSLIKPFGKNTVTDVVMFRTIFSTISPINIKSDPNCWIIEMIGSYSF